MYKSMVSNTLPPPSGIVHNNWWLLISACFNAFQEEEDDLQMLIVTIQEQLRKANFEDFSNMMDSCRHEDVLGWVTTVCKKTFSGSFLFCHYAKFFYIKWRKRLVFNKTGLLEIELNILIPWHFVSCNPHWNIHWTYMKWVWIYYTTTWSLFRVVNPLCHQILRIDREGMLDDVISHNKWHHLCQKSLLIPVDICSTSTVHI